MKEFDYIGTYSDAKIYFNEEKQDLSQYRMEDISRSLSMQCRFNGHIKKFYSVAEHCLLLSRLYMKKYPNDYLGGYSMLMHDASEAYLCDVPRPLKRFLTNYDLYEKRIQGAIMDKYNVPEMNEVQILLDSHVVRDEGEELFKYPPSWLNNFEKVGIELYYYDPYSAMLRFERAFNNFRVKLGIDKNIS